MKKFEILEHTADLKMKVYGASLEELFFNAMSGMMSILYSEILDLRSKNLNNIKVKIESTDSNSLLIDFLNEVLYQTQVNKEVYVDVNFLGFSEKALEAEISGIKVDKFDEDIKAVTYHKVEIKKGPDGFETLILFDI